MRPIQILLIEDNEGDIMLTKEAFEEVDTPKDLSVVQDGAAAIDYLNKSGKFIDSETPDLILLDINLPKLNGHEVLQYIKSNEDLRNIPVIMLTTSSTKNDINKAYSFGANSYVTKSHGYDDFMESIKNILKYWTKVVILPIGPDFMGK